MERLYIQGGKRISGEIDVQGAKNSALPLLAATILTEGKSVLHNCPDLSDINAACKILSYLGCDVTYSGNTVTVDAANITNTDIPESLMSEMRSSIVFLGALAARVGKTKLCFPGGCELGPRPIDLHLSSLRQLGLDIKEEHGYLDCHRTKRLRGAKIMLSFPSVGATENIMLASVTADGETIITNAAGEPEIVDLADYLNKCGAKITGAGESTVIIKGVDNLQGTEHSVIPDRIVASTYLCAGAITGGELLIKKCNPTHIESVLPVLEQTGCKIITGADNIYIRAPERLCHMETVRTMPYPGFPTDAQAPLMPLAVIANGTSVFVENIFESRYKQVSELRKMGADIRIEGKVAVIEGVDRIYGANVRATDLRGGASLIIAGLAAEGETVISDIYHIDRGYERIEDNLRSIGAKIKRI
ncbi:MAG: UDP-N-acetylglucosamine 1-carboxyvinyltransferase [Oscillospiraceae bacterium]|nr:UDP-N-acetylglucosamine 1-carboxyvinyltransferase [Oscillospiraceae bacterium]